jgi:hypothetical protein
MGVTGRVGIAVAIAAAIYFAGLGAGSLLYATGAIATGATHNDCANFQRTLAPQYGGHEGDVPQSAIKAEAERCLAQHTLTAGEAFRSEYLLWPAWPAAICAIVFLAWPHWARVLRNQDIADGIGVGAKAGQA